MARIFTRRELYDLVWSKPVTHLAKELALSDVAIHKICRRHDIPKPPVGWWARKQAGKPVRQTPLPELEDGRETQITIASADLGREGAAFAGIREQARVRAAQVPEADGRAHPVVERTIAELRKARASDIGLVATTGVGLIACSVSPASVDRLEVILTRVAHAALLQGFTLVAGERPAVFRSAEETVSFTVSGTYRRVKHVLTEAEEASLRAWERKREQTRSRDPWDVSLWSGRPRSAEWDHIPTGQLSFEFESVYMMEGPSPRRSFRDAKIQRLENMASDIAVGLAVLAAAKAEARRRREARDREIEEARRERERHARLKHVDDRRRAGVSDVLRELDDIGKLRQLTGQLEREGVQALSPRVTMFLSRLEQDLARREARLSAHGLEARFEEDRLFGDDDDHDFRRYGW